MPPDATAPGAVTPGGIRDGDPQVLNALCARRGPAVLAFTSRVARADAVRAAARAMAHFRAEVAGASGPIRRHPDAMLLSAARRAALAHAPAGPEPGCSRVPPMLADRAEGELDASRAARLERHLELCASCTSLAASVAIAETAYREAPETPLSPETTEAIVAAMTAAAPVAEAATSEPPIPGPADEGAEPEPTAGEEGALADGHAATGEEPAPQPDDDAPPGGPEPLADETATAGSDAPEVEEGVPTGVGEDEEVAPPELGAPVADEPPPAPPRPHLTLVPDPQAPEPVEVERDPSLFLGYAAGTGSSTGGVDDMAPAADELDTGAPTAQQPVLPIPEFEDAAESAGAGEPAGADDESTDVDAPEAVADGGESATTGAEGDDTATEDHEPTAETDDTATEDHGVPQEEDAPARPRPMVGTFPRPFEPLVDVPPVVVKRRTGGLAGRVAGAAKALKGAVERRRSAPEPIVPDGRTVGDEPRSAAPGPEIAGADDAEPEAVAIVPKPLREVAPDTTDSWDAIGEITFPERPDAEAEPPLILPRSGDRRWTFGTAAPVPVLPRADRGAGEHAPLRSHGKRALAIPATMLIAATVVILAVAGVFGGQEPSRPTGTDASTVRAPVAAANSATNISLSAAERLRPIRRATRSEGGEAATP